jgi:hypothetical protein
MPANTPVQSVLPAELLELIRTLPPLLTRKDASPVLEKYIGIKSSPRSLEAWNIRGQIICGKFMASTVEWFEVAYENVSAAPLIMSGRRPVGRQQAA